MQRRARSLVPGALRGSPPLAGAAARPSGSLQLHWVTPSLDDLVRTSRTPGGRVALDLDPADDDRLRTLVARVVAGPARQGSIEVTGRRGPVWLHLHLHPDARRAPVAAGTRRDRSVLVVGQPAPSAPAVTEEADGRASVVARLAVALLRLRRHPGRVALAVAHVPPGRGMAGPTVGPELVDRVRAGARDTDLVGRIGPDAVAVVADDLGPDGELVLGRRLTSSLQGQVAGTGRGVRTVAVAVTDPATDAEGLLQHLVDQARAPSAEPGLTVLSGWSPSVAVTTEQDSGGSGIRAALTSGRFVLGARPVRALLDVDGGPGSAPGPALVEVAIEDHGTLSPVRVAAPGLAAALDGWLLEQVGAAAPDGVVVVCLQPGGTLTAELGDQVRALRGRRPDLEVQLAVPETRLAEALAAERAVLPTLEGAGVGLAVTAWTGLLAPTTLVAHRISLVELAAEIPASTLTPIGSAAVAALCAAVRVGIGPAAVVVADEPGAEESLALADCGVRHRAPTRPVHLASALTLSRTRGERR